MPFSRLGRFSWIASFSPLFPKRCMPRGNAVARALGSTHLILSAVLSIRSVSLCCLVLFDGFACFAATSLDLREVEHYSSEASALLAAERLDLTQLGRIDAEAHFAAKRLGEM